MNPAPLHLCTATLLPDPYSLSEPQFEAMVVGCEAAGARGISFWTLHHHLLGQHGWSTDAIRGRLSAAGLEVSCLEAIAGWANASTVDAALADAEPTFALAVDYGATTVTAVTLDPELASFDHAVANLAAVAARAAQAGIAVAVEFLPWSAIADIGTCWELLRRTEADNVGFCFDSWHWHRQPGGATGANAELLASIPGEAIRVFQLCDAAPEPQGDPMTECMTSRRLPGEGAVDHDHLLALFVEIGADPLVTPEVFNAELAATGPVAMAESVVAASRLVLARGLWT